MDVVYFFYNLLDRLSGINVNSRIICNISISDGIKKAIPTSGVTCNARLVYLEENGITIAIPPELHESLDMAGGFSFSP